MTFFHLVLGVLCVYRTAHLLNAEDGPWDIMVKIRRAAGHSMVGKMMDCFDCASVWCALPFAIILGDSLKGRALLVPALSAGAMVLHKVTERLRVPAPVALYEEDDESKVVLRTESSPSDPPPGDA